MTQKPKLLASIPAWLIALPMIFSALCAQAHAAWKPEHNVELISAVSAGGANDRVVRLLQQIWRQKHIVDASTTVLNKPGGGGVIAENYILQHKGDGHYLQVTSSDLLTARIVGTSPLSYTDFTQIGLLFNEYFVAAVRADSPIHNAHDLIEKLKANPQSVSIALATSLGNQIHAGLAIPLKIAGVNIKKLKIAVFSSGGEAMTALLGGHVDLVATTPFNAVSQMQAGRLRIIAITSAKRMGGALANVPTWKEQGVDVDFSAPQFVIAPPGLTAEQAAYWSAALKRLVEQDEWKRELARNFWESNYQNPADTKKYLDYKSKELTSVLTELGLARQ
jgi:putative tricarboxylic transport membrane protein